MSDFKKTSLRRAPKKASALVLGYTRAGRPVLRPTREAPDTHSRDVLRLIKEKFADWTGGEHRDASRILMEHGEREPDGEISSWCKRWSRVHRDLGGRRTATEVN
jgi:hypothetical protein